MNTNINSEESLTIPTNKARSFLEGLALMCMVLLVPIAAMLPS